MATVRDLLSRSLKLIGVLADGETASASMAQDALSTLNDMTEAWGVEGLMIYENERQVFPLVGGQSLYTMGVSGNFNTQRPNLISYAGLELTSSSPVIELPLEIITEQEWAMITDKNMSSTVPTRIYVVDSFPLKKIYVWPVPSDANNLVLYTPKQINNFASINDTILLPPGYSRAIRYNLAVELAEEYGRELRSKTYEIAITSKAEIARLNTKNQIAIPDSFGMGAGFNVLTGDSN